LYQAFYHLKTDPFRMNPDPAFMCMTMQHREALSGLIYAACTRPGLTLLLGEAGTGKTTVLYSLLALLEKRRFITALCTNPTLSRTEFYDLLLMKFGVECGSTLKSRQLAALESMLQRNRADGRPAILIVDEAQRLPSELLEEIRLLLNLETPREKLLDIVVAGQPEFGDVLRRPDMRQLKQRVSSVCKLGPLTPEELKEYIDHRLTLAGLSDQRLFPEAVIRCIHEYTQGIPRLVNSLCDSALLLGFATESPEITPAIVEEAAGDLDLAKGDLFSGSSLNNHQALLESASRYADATVGNGGSGSKNHRKNGNGDRRESSDDYNDRQKSLRLFSSLMDRWR
jgi:general secretion pathway protein A